MKTKLRDEVATSELLRVKLQAVSNEGQWDNGDYNNHNGMKMVMMMTVDDWFLVSVQFYNVIGFERRIFHLLSITTIILGLT